ncbi:Ubiquitin carboxyl-terminal hydrolase 37 [Merluccius polli]|uniref:Ubiquitin carboxyl-terminal hydrolase n=1 Tax=Merluccius polli TaxID=89951 RepID=A0AA47M541_MERPO|nr:Ubiquitin carboxyl-terminal hydrolase 37 [Merluccius polli]
MFDMRFTFSPNTMEARTKLCTAHESPGCDVTPALLCSASVHLVVQARHSSFHRFSCVDFHCCFFNALLRSFAPLSEAMQRSCRRLRVRPDVLLCRLRPRFSSAPLAGGGSWLLPQRGHLSPAQVSSLWSLPPGTCEEMAVVFQQTQRLFCSSFLWVRVAMSILACLEQVLGPRERLVGALFMAPHLITHYVSYLLALSVARLVPDQLDATQGDLMPRTIVKRKRPDMQHFCAKRTVRSPDVSDSSSASSTAASSSPASSSDSGTQEVSEQSSSETTNDRQLKAENKCRSGRSKTQLGQEKKLGLPNIGNTCFLNSALQGLYGLPCFCSDITRQEALWSPQGGTTLKLLRYLGELYKSRQGQSSNRSKRRLLWSIKSSLAELNEGYKDHSEQDAHVFLLLLFMKMKMEGEALQGTTPSLRYICPVQNFEFRLQCVRTCSSCGDTVFQEEEENSLSLDLHPTLLYFKPSELECTCRQCSGRQATVVRHFLTLPRVLVLHLKRFHHDGAKLRKVTDAVSIPPLLSLASLVGEQGDAAGMGTLRASYQTSDHIPAQFKPTAGKALDQPDQTTYCLSGIVSHLGESINTGHYISDIVEEQGGGWLTFNDSRVEKTAEPAVLKAREQTAYILFYVLWRVRPRPPGSEPGVTWSRCACSAPSLPPSCSGEEVVQEAHLAALQEERLAALQEERLAALQEQRLAALQEERLAALQEENLAALQEESLAALQEQRLAALQEQRLAVLQEQRLAALQEQRLAALQEQRLAVLQEESLAALQEERLAALQEQRMAALQEQRLAALP